MLRISALMFLLTQNANPLNRDFRREVGDFEDVLEPENEDYDFNGSNLKFKRERPERSNSSEISSRSSTKEDELTLEYIHEKLDEIGRLFAERIFKDEYENVKRNITKIQDEPQEIVIKEENNYETPPSLNKDYGSVEVRFYKYFPLATEEDNSKDKRNIDESETPLKFDLLSDYRSNLDDSIDYNKYDYIGVINNQNHDFPHFQFMPANSRKKRQSFKAFTKFRYKRMANDKKFDPFKNLKAFVDEDKLNSKNLSYAPIFFVSVRTPKEEIAANNSEKTKNLEQTLKYNEEGTENIYLRDTHFLNGYLSNSSMGQNRIQAGIILYPKYESFQGPQLQHDVPKQRSLNEDEFDLFEDTEEPRQITSGHKREDKISTEKTNCKFTVHPNCSIVINEKPNPPLDNDIDNVINTLLLNITNKTEINVTTTEKGISLSIPSIPGFSLPENPLENPTTSIPIIENTAITKLVNNATETNTSFSQNQTESISNFAPKRFGRSAVVQNKIKNLQNDLRIANELKEILDKMEEKHGEQRKKRKIDTSELNSVLSLLSYYKIKAEENDDELNQKDLDNVKDLVKVLQWKLAQPVNFENRLKRFIFGKKKKRKKKKWQQLPKFSGLNSHNIKLREVENSNISTVVVNKDEDYKDYQDNETKKPIIIGHKIRKRETDSSTGIWNEFNWPSQDETVTESEKQDTGIWNEFNWPDFRKQDINMEENQKVNTEESVSLGKQAETTTDFNWPKFYDQGKNIFENTESSINEETTTESMVKSLLKNENETLQYSSNVLNSDKESVTIGSEQEETTGIWKGFNWPKFGKEEEITEELQSTVNDEKETTGIWQGFNWPEFDKVKVITEELIATESEKNETTGIWQGFNWPKFNKVDTNTESEETSITEKNQEILQYTYDLLNFGKEKSVIIENKHEETTTVGQGFSWFKFSKEEITEKLKHTNSDKEPNTDNGQKFSWSRIANKGTEEIQTEKTELNKTTNIWKVLNWSKINEENTNVVKSTEIKNDLNWPKFNKIETTTESGETIKMKNDKKTLEFSLNLPNFDKVEDKQKGTTYIWQEFSWSNLSRTEDQIIETTENETIDIEQQDLNFHKSNEEKTNVIKNKEVTTEIWNTFNEVEITTEFEETSLIEDEKVTLQYSPSLLIYGKEELVNTKDEQKETISIWQGFTSPKYSREDISEEIINTEGEKETTEEVSDKYNWEKFNSEKLNDLESHSKTDFENLIDQVNFLSEDEKSTDIWQSINLPKLSIQTSNTIEKIEETTKEFSSTKDKEMKTTKISDDLNWPVSIADEMISTEDETNNDPYTNINFKELISETTNEEKNIMKTQNTIKTEINLYKDKNIQQIIKEANLILNKTKNSIEISTKSLNLNLDFEKITSDEENNEEDEIDKTIFLTTVISEIAENQIDNVIHNINKELSSYVSSENKDVITDLEEDNFSEKTVQEVTKYEYLNLGSKTNVPNEYKDQETDNEIVTFTEEMDEEIEKTINTENMEKTSETTYVSFQQTDTIIFDETNVPDKKIDNIINDQIENVLKETNKEIANKIQTEIINSNNSEEATNLRNVDKEPSKTLDNKLKQNTFLEKENYFLPTDKKISSEYKKLNLGINVNLRNENIVEEVKNILQMEEKSSSVYWQENLKEGINFPNKKSNTTILNMLNLPYENMEEQKIYNFEDILQSTRKETEQFQNEFQNINEPLNVKEENNLEIPILSLETEIALTGEEISSTKMLKFNFIDTSTEEQNNIKNLSLELEKNLITSKQIMNKENFQTDSEYEETENFYTFNIPTATLDTNLRLTVQDLINEVSEITVENKETKTFQLNFNNQLKEETTTKKVDTFKWDQNSKYEVNNILEEAETLENKLKNENKTTKKEKESSTKSWSWFHSNLYQQTSNFLNIVTQTKIEKNKTSTEEKFIKNKPTIFGTEKESQQTSYQTENSLKSKLASTENEDKEEITKKINPNAKKLYKKKTIKEVFEELIGPNLKHHYKTATLCESCEEKQETKENLKETSKKGHPYEDISKDVFTYFNNKESSTLCEGCQGENVQKKTPHNKINTKKPHEEVAEGEFAYFKQNHESSTICEECEYEEVEVTKDNIKVKSRINSGKVQSTHQEESENKIFGYFKNDQKTSKVNKETQTENYKSFKISNKKQKNNKKLNKVSTKSYEVSEGNNEPNTNMYEKNINTETINTSTVTKAYKKGTDYKAKETSIFRTTQELKQNEEQKSFSITENVSEEKKISTEKMISTREFNTEIEKVNLDEVTAKSKFQTTNYISKLNQYATETLASEEITTEATYTVNTITEIEKSEKVSNSYKKTEESSEQETEKMTEEIQQIATVKEGITNESQENVEMEQTNKEYQTDKIGITFKNTNYKKNEFKTTLNLEEKPETIANSYEETKECSNQGIEKITVEDETKESYSSSTTELFFTNKMMLSSDQNPPDQNKGINKQVTNEEAEHTSIVETENQSETTEHFLLTSIQNTKMSKGTITIESYKSSNTKENFEPSDFFTENIEQKSELINTLETTFVLPETELEELTSEENKFTETEEMSEHNTISSQIESVTSEIKTEENRTPQTTTEKVTQKEESKENTLPTIKEETKTNKIFTPEIQLKSESAGKFKDISQTTLTETITESVLNKNATYESEKTTEQTIKNTEKGLELDSIKTEEIFTLTTITEEETVTTEISSESTFDKTSETEFYKDTNETETKETESATESPKDEDDEKKEKEEEEEEEEEEEGKSKIEKTTETNKLEEITKTSKQFKNSSELTDETKSEYNEIISENINLQTFSTKTSRTEEENYLLYDTETEYEITEILQSERNKGVNVNSEMKKGTKTSDLNTFTTPEIKITKENLETDSVNKTLATTLLNTKNSNEKTEPNKNIAEEKLQSTKMILEVGTKNETTKSTEKYLLTEETEITTLNEYEDTNQKTESNQESNSEKIETEKTEFTETAEVSLRTETNLKITSVRSNNKSKDHFTVTEKNATTLRQYENTNSQKTELNKETTREEDSLKTEANSRNISTKSSFENKGTLTREEEKITTYSHTDTSKDITINNNLLSTSEEKVTEQYENIENSINQEISGTTPNYTKATTFNNFRKSTDNLNVTALSSREEIIDVTKHEKISENTVNLLETSTVFAKTEKSVATFSQNMELETTTSVVLFTNLVPNILTELQETETYITNEELEETIKSTTILSINDLEDSFKKTTKIEKISNSKELVEEISNVTETTIELENKNITNFFQKSSKTDLIEKKLKTAQLPEQYSTTVETTIISPTTENEEFETNTEASKVSFTELRTSMVSTTEIEKQNFSLYSLTETQKLLQSSSKISLTEKSFTNEDATSIKKIISLKQEVPVEKGTTIEEEISLQNEYKLKTTKLILDKGKTEKNKITSQSLDINSQIETVTEIDKTEEHNTGFRKLTSINNLKPQLHEESDENSMPHFTNKHESSTVCKICETKEILTKTITKEHQQTSKKPNIHEEKLNEEDIDISSKHESSTICEICNNQIENTSKNVKFATKINEMKTSTTKFKHKTTSKPKSTTRNKFHTNTEKIRTTLESTKKFEGEKTKDIFKPGTTTLKFKTNVAKSTTQEITNSEYATLSSSKIISQNTETDYDIAEKQKSVTELFSIEKLFEPTTSLLSFNTNIEETAENTNQFSTKKYSTLTNTSAKKKINLNKTSEMEETEIFSFSTLSSKPKEGYENGIKENTTAEKTIKKTDKTYEEYENITESLVQSSDESISPVFSSVIIESNEDEHVNNTKETTTNKQFIDESASDIIPTRKDYEVEIGKISEDVEKYTTEPNLSNTNFDANKITDLTTLKQKVTSQQFEETEKFSSNQKISIYPSTFQFTKTNFQEKTVGEEFQKITETEIFSSLEEKENKETNNELEINFGSESFTNSEFEFINKTISVEEEEKNELLLGTTITDFLIENITEPFMSYNAVTTSEGIFDDTAEELIETYTIKGSSSVTSEDEKNKKIKEELLKIREETTVNFKEKEETSTKPTRNFLTSTSKALNISTTLLLLISSVYGSKSSRTTTHVPIHIDLPVFDVINEPKNIDSSNCIVLFIKGRDNLKRLNGTKWIKAGSVEFPTEETTIEYPTEMETILNELQAITKEKATSLKESTITQKNTSKPKWSTTEATTEEMEFSTQFKTTEETKEETTSVLANTSEENECSQDDFNEHKNCVCSTDKFVRKLKSVLNVNSFKMSNLDCEHFLKVNQKLVIGNNSLPLRKKRSYTFIERQNRIRTRQAVDYEKVENFFNQKLEILNNDNKIFALAGTKVLIPCFHNSEPIQYNPLMKFVWDFEKHTLSEHQIKESDGGLIIESALPKNSGNYTCKVSNNFEEDASVVSYDHTLIVIRIPIYKIKTNIIYSLNETCDLTDGDVMYLYLPKILDGILCGVEDKMCKLDFNRPKCINQNQDYFINVTFTTIINSLESISPTMTNAVCDISCQMLIYSKMVTILLKNIEMVEKLPVSSQLVMKKMYYNPRKVENTKKGLFSKLPLLLIACPEGYGINKQQLKICEVCPRNTYSVEGESYCKPCLSNHYQNAPGSKSCIQCSSPLEDKACFPLLFSNNNRNFLYYVVGFFGVAILLIVILIIVGSRKEGGRESTPVYTRYTRQDFDVERGSAQPFIERYPPKLPPKDF